MQRRYRLRFKHSKICGVGRENQMKWINKGHEYDKSASKWVQTESVYLYGGLSENGNELIRLLSFLHLSEQFKIYIVETNERKQIGAASDYVISLHNMLSRIYENNTYVVVDCTRDDSMIKTLLKCTSLKYRKTVFTKGYFERTFLPVYMWYKFQKGFCYSAAVHFSTKCNLRCKNCMILTPHNHDQRERDISEVLNDIDALFEKFDYVYRFGTSGGEPLLYKEIPTIISHSMKYSDKMFSIGITTNSTIPMRQELIDAIVNFNKGSKYYELGGGSIVTIDDYSDYVKTSKPQIIEEKCIEHGINHSVNKYDFWIDTELSKDNKINGEEAMTAFHDMCDNTCWWLCDKHMYTCSLVLSACNTGYIEDEPNNSVDLKNCSIPEFIEFQSGYTEKGYFDLCGKCKGYVDINRNYVKAGKQ